MHCLKDISLWGDQTKQCHLVALVKTCINKASTESLFSALSISGLTLFLVWIITEIFNQKEKDVIWSCLRNWLFFATGVACLDPPCSFPVASWPGCPPRLWSLKVLDIISGAQPFTTFHDWFPKKWRFAPWLMIILKHLLHLHTYTNLNICVYVPIMWSPNHWVKLWLYTNNCRTPTSNPPSTGVSAPLTFHYSAVRSWRWKARPNLGARMLR